MMARVRFSHTTIESHFASFLCRVVCDMPAGGPGCGKGTQCKLITSTFGYVHLSAGDLLREERNTGSELADMINTFIKEGKIVPAEVTINLLRKAMHASGKRRFLIDGFPRKLDNLEAWMEAMGGESVLGMVLVFDCPEDVMEERLMERGKTSGRSDDNAETIKKRYARPLPSQILSFSLCETYLWT